MLYKFNILYQIFIYKTYILLQISLFQIIFYDKSVCKKLYQAKIRSIKLKLLKL